MRSDLFALFLVKQWLKTSWKAQVIFIVNTGKPMDTSCLNEHSLSLCLVGQVMAVPVNSESSLISDKIDPAEVV